MNTEQTLVSMGNQNSTNTDMIQDEINQDDKIRIPYRNRFQHTPTDILKSNLENCPANREPLLFLTVGSLCPVHVQHVQIQEIAKRHLEDNFPVQVVGGFMASAHDRYVLSKYRHANRMESFIAWNERIKLIELALTDHPWIRCDHWEGHEDDFYEYFDTQKSFELFLSEWCQKNGFSRVPKLLMVAGADLVAKCHLVSWYPQQNLGCICVERPGYTLPEIADWSKQMQLEKKFFVVHLPQSYIDKFGLEDVSSTKVQAMLRSGEAENIEKVRTILHPKVLEALLEMWKINIKI